MKQIFLVFIFLIFSSFAYAFEQPSAHEIENFITKIDSYCKNGDIKGIQGLYFFDGVSEELRDVLIYNWENNLINYKKRYNMKYDGAKYIPLDDYLSSLENEYDIIDFIRPTVMNGRIYISNLNVVGVVSIALSIPSGGTSYSVYAVGNSKDSKLYFTAPIKQ